MKSTHFSLPGMQLVEEEPGDWQATISSRCVPVVNNYPHLFLRVGFGIRTVLLQPVLSTTSALPDADSPCGCAPGAQLAGVPTANNLCVLVTQDGSWTLCLDPLQQRHMRDLNIARELAESRSEEPTDLLGGRLLKLTRTDTKTPG